MNYILQIKKYYIEVIINLPMNHTFQGGHSTRRLPPPTSTGYDSPTPPPRGMPMPPSHFSPPPPELPKHLSRGPSRKLILFTFQTIQNFGFST